MDYKGKGIVITGAASGIGLATASALAARGANVMLSDIEASALEVARSSVAAVAKGGVIDAAVCDVSRLDQVQALADAAFARLAGVHVVFLNAGVGVSGPITTMRHEDWQWVMGVNLWGAIHGAEAFAARMVAQKQGGQIVFNSSFAGVVYSPTLGPYCVSKAGVVALAEVLRQELRAENIGVSVMCPMRIATNIGSSGRNRTPDFGGAQGSPELIDPRDKSLPGVILDVDEVVAKIIDGIDNNEAYIMTHAEGRSYIQRRFDKIDASFERQHPAASTSR